MMVLHILTGFIALAAGATALCADKGGSLHGRSGRVFVAAMLGMTLSGGAIAAVQMFAEPIHQMNVIVATLTCYLVVSGWLTVRRSVVEHRWMHVAAMLVASVVAVASLILASAGGGTAPIYVVCSIVALVAVALDLRMLRTGGLQGAQRIARHLWRMLFALWIATAAFFLGQADEIPQPVRNMAVLSTPVLIVFGAMLYWLVRVLRGRRAPLVRPHA